MSWRAWAITGWTGVVFVLATLLLSNPGDERAIPRASASPTLLQLLTMPISRSQPAELRLMVLPLGWAGLLLIFAASPKNPEMPILPNRKKKDRTAEKPISPSASLISAYWLEILAVSTITLAVVSAFANDSWLLSRGWILQLAAGCGWAILISRMTDQRCIERLLLAGAIVALFAVAFSFWHRQMYHVEYFAWPIGPVTLTAGMGAIWAAIALAYAISLVPRLGRENASRRGIVWTIIVLLASLAMLFVAARRGAWLAVIGAAVYAAILLVCRYTSARRGRWIALGTAAAMSLLATVYVAAQSRSSDPKASIPITYRFIYWKNTVSHLADAWLLGQGPDSFLCKMSAIIADQRARMPRLLHGTIDPEAHNEWLQAMFELGLPGGLLYLAIPLIAVILATRAWLRSADAIRRTLLLACAAGIVSILTSEAGSICLRRGGMNVWYWTLIGAVIVLSRDGPRPSHRHAPRLVAPARLAAIAVALFFSIVIVGEGRRRVAHARGNLQKTADPRQATESLAEAGWRLGAWQALAARADLGDAQLAAAGTSAPDARQAADTWREINNVCPAYPGAAFRLAQTLQLAGDTPAACDVLHRHLTTVNPHDMAINNLYIGMCPLEPLDILACVQRALRDGEWTPAIEPKLAEAFESPTVSRDWMNQVLAAMQTVVSDAPQDWADSSAPETLRIEAARFAAAGDIGAAARMQALAFDAYARLEKKQSRYRRSAFAEADAALRLARFTFAADPSKLPDALSRVRDAERLAMKGVPLRTVAGADPRSEWVGGQRVPAEFPARLRPLWRFSALLHLANGSDRGLVHQRIEWSLSDDRRSPQEMNTVLSAISGELVALFERHDPSRRPSHYPDIVALARAGAVQSSIPTRGQ